MSLRAAAYGLIVAGLALALVAGAQPWWRAVGAEVSVSFTGTASTGGLNQALAAVAAAALLLTLAVKAAGRRVVGALIGLVGAGAAVTGALRPRPSAEAVLSQVREATLADQFALAGTPWPWVFAGGGAALLAGGVLMAVTAGRWRSRPDRFARSAPQPVQASDDPAEVWKAMDAGLDPTACPDVHDRPSGDTMGDAGEVSQRHDPDRLHGRGGNV